MPRLSRALLEQRRDAKIRLLASIGPLIQGSFYRFELTCGKPGCRCARGEKHTSRQITRKVRGKSRTLYVPKEMEQEVREWTQAYRRAKTLIRQISDLNEKILRGHVAAGRARKRNRDAASSAST